MPPLINPKLIPIGLPWCREEDYDSFVHIFEDASDLPETWKHFMPEEPELIVGLDKQTAGQAAAQIVALLTARGLIDHIDDLAADWSI